MSLDHRLQILIDDERHRRIVRAANERGVSVATVVREAIDRGVGGPSARRRAAGRRVLAAADMPVPEPSELRTELEALRGRRRPAPHHPGRSRRRSAVQRLWRRIAPPNVALTIGRWMCWVAP
jgi:hypothetical protein